MANPIPKPIIGAFEDIGEQIVHEVKKLPIDIAEQALESVGMNVGGKQGTTKAQNPKPGTTQTEGSAYQQMDQTTDQKIKREIARKALEELIQSAPKPKEKSIWEKIQEEEAQKKEAQKQQQTQQSSQLPMPTSKPKRGNLYGAKQKQTAVENKATKSD
jgi:hypothetical protein